MEYTDFLYPEIEPYDTGHLDVGDGHTMYYEQSGHPDGIAIVNLHGGPGSDLSGWRRSLFNPEKYRLIQYDQRGCGQSTPHATLENNTTPHLVEDMEKLRNHLGLESWHVSGTSWGSALALAYADKHADKIESMVVGGIFMGRPEEMFNMYGKGGVVSQVFPDIFEPFYNLLPDDHKDDPAQGYYEMFTSDDEQTRLKAIRAWTTLEATVSMLETDPAMIEEYLEDPDFVLTHSLFENHYFRHSCFMDGNALLKSLPDKLTGKAVHIIQGRYDMVCPFETAWQLHTAIKGSHLHIIPNAGHSAKEPLTTRKLREVLDTL